jgi:DNA (cytosine-5)-methyltransferase 1
MNSQSKVGVFSFFSGAGFLDLGFEDTEPFEVVFVNEVHKPFMDIYKYSRARMKRAEPVFGHHENDICDFLSGGKGEQISDWTNTAKANYDLIGFIGGPPCPDFSVAGKNRGATGENGVLSQSYIDLIVKESPDFFLFENVKGLYRTKKHREFFEKIKRELESNDYVLTERLINSIEYGVAQDRERIILIGIKSSNFTSQQSSDSQNRMLENFNWVPSKEDRLDIFSKNWPTQEAFEEDSIRTCPANIPIELTVEYWFELNDTNNHPNSKHHFTPRGALPRFLTISEGDDLKKSFKRLHRWRYSPTAAYGNNEVHLHPYKARRLSAAEALAIQSLPKEFELPPTTTLTNMFKTIGNGVPYLAAKSLAEGISELLDNIKDQYADVA